MRTAFYAIAAAFILFMQVNPAGAVDITINRAQKYQTIDGFGFFGGMDVWWGGSAPSRFYNQAWLDKVVGDLGLTLWRNEYYSEETNQDANWAKQRPLVQAFKATADKYGVALKFIWSVWSPPSSMKCAGSNGCWGMPATGAWSTGLKGGGTLCAASHAGFADWLKTGVRNYKDIGIDLYALSFQNEPLFCQSYNSCFYDYGYYSTVLKAVAPVVKAAYPAVKFFGAEHMLSSNMNNGTSQFQYIYESNIKQANAAQYLDIWAYHGYSDGVNPTPSTEMARLWSLVRDSLRTTAKPLWQTETSNYTDAWGAISGGAMELAAAIHAGLYYGNMSGWVWWQGCAYNTVTGAIGTYEMMNSVNGTVYTSKKYAVSKQYYRYIRPGAVRVSSVITGDNTVYATAFEHTAMGSFTVVVVNTAATEKQIALTGANVPSGYTVYQTTAAADCANKGTIAGTTVTLPALSMTTLVNGNVFETPVSIKRQALPYIAQQQSPVRMRVHTMDGRLVGSVKAVGLGDLGNLGMSGRTTGAYVVSSGSGIARTMITGK